MTDPTLIFFCATLALVAVLYSCVGQAGASGYIAAMALFGFAPGAIRPTALVLNVLVSARFWRAGHFSGRLLWPFAVASVPAALLGGWVTLPPVVFNRLLGALLLIAAGPFLLKRGGAGSRLVTSAPLPAALLTGAGVGFLSGLTGVGGGVLITPVLLWRGWAAPQPAAAVSAVFILINSLAALLGQVGAGSATAAALPARWPLFALAAVLGGAAGSHLGSARLSAVAIRRILGVVLLLAGLKLILA